MTREELIKVIREKSLIYQDENLEEYSNKQLQDIKKALFIELQQKIKFRMTITQSNDEKLKEVLLNNSKVIVFYYKKDSELCKQLLEDFIKLSLNDSYRALAFVAIDIENSISAERLSKQIPIVSCYHN